MALQDLGHTSVLLHFDGNQDGTTFTDETGKSWARVGSAVTKADTKKLGTASMYLDGAGDWITTTDHADFYLVGDFTLDMWLRFSDFPIAGSYYQIFQQYQGANDWQTLAFTNVAGVHSFNWQIRVGGADNVNFTRACTSNLNLNTWYHFRICRNGDDYKMYVDGAKIGATETDAGVVSNFTGTIYIGCHAGSASVYYGYIDEFRLVNGIAEVTGDSFEIPTIPYAPHVDDSDTIHLLHFNSRDAVTKVIDQTGIPWTLTGTAQIDDAQSVFGGTSLFLDGNSDYISTVDSATYDLGINDFCVEMRVRWAGLPADGTAQEIWTHYQDVNTRVALYIYNTVGVYSLRAKAWQSGVELFGMMRNWAGLVIDTWYHIAWSRDTMRNRLFVDGTELVPNAEDSTSFPSISGSIRIGAQSASNYLNGWVDEYRFSMNNSRYTADFTIEPSAFGPYITETESLYMEDTHALFDNELAVTFPPNEYVFDGEQIIRILDVTLPLLEQDIFVLRGDVGSIDIDLPTITTATNMYSGIVGSIDLSIPIITPNLMAAGKMAFSMPIKLSDVNVLLGTVSQLNTILPTLINSLSGHINGIGTLSIGLPVNTFISTGMLHGFGSFGIILPIKNIIKTGLTGTIGQLDVSLPDIRVTIRSSFKGNMVLDVTLPCLILDNYGVYKPSSVTYKGVVINTKNMAVTEYDSFRFNSMGNLLSNDIGVNENGIYIIGGRPSNSSFIETPEYDLSNGLIGIPRNVWLSMRSDGKLILTVRVDEENKYEYDITGLSDSIHEERTKLGKGIKGRFASLKIQNDNYADFDLTSLSILSEMIQSKRR